MSRFNVSCQKIRNDVLRLHVIANSDSEDDQSLKLKVRDRILSETGDLFLASTSYEEAVELTNKILPQIIGVAEDEIRLNGFDYTVRAKLDYIDFDTRHYDGYTLPAGEYLALNVTIGEGKGRNWWCVMFPSICLSPSLDLDDKLSDDEIDLIKGYENYKVKFKLVEWYEKVASIF
ncbi:MAG: stage II sporulation protein R [Clostridia bacterium]|nr:stage II sporulation protein R [Clostridia bacterium]